MKAWRKHVRQIAEDLSNALEAEYVMLGGGNGRLFKKLPTKVRLGSDDHAFDGAFRLWQKPQTLTLQR